MPQGRREKGTKNSWKRDQEEELWTVGFRCMKIVGITRWRLLEMSDRWCVRHKSDQINCLLTFWLTAMEVDWNFSDSQLHHDCLPVVTIDNRILNFLDWILLRNFHSENVNFHGLKMARHFGRRAAIGRRNTPHHNYIAVHARKLTSFCLRT